MVGSRPNQAAYRRARASLRRRRLPCHICGQPIDYDAPAKHPDSFEADHDVAVALGGTDDLSNLAPSHRRCNLAKGKRPHAPIIRRSTALQ